MDEQEILARADSGLPISAVSQLLGIPVPTIRSWERRYDFPAPARTRGQHRRYTLREVEQLRRMRDEITRGFAARQAVAIARRSANGAPGPRLQLLDDFLDATMRLDPTGIRSALDSATETLGVEAAIADLALPAMREIGSRWRSGECDVANEHLATEGVRGWLARLAALAPPAFRPHRLVLACGPKDLHAIGLEAFGVLLARRGWSCRTLGALTPTPSLVAAVRTAEASAAVIASHRSVTRRAAVEAIEAVARLRWVHVLYAGGAFAAPISRRGVPGTYLGDDLIEAISVLESELSRG